MVVLGGIVGGIVGFLIGLLITEALIGTPANSSGFDWQFWTDILLAVLGVLAGAALAKRFVGRNARLS